jgi:pSer/pThr/pTyr-binding forkhead associated (FHA) protein
MSWGAKSVIQYPEALGMAFLEVYIPDGKIEHFELSKSSMTVGRSPEADISIQLPVMSRIHARIEKNGKNRWVVTDLESRNKTIFNHQAVKSHTLTHKDIFYFGSIKVVFQDPSGASNEKGTHTVALKPQKAKPEAEAEVAPPEGNSCPRCKAEMPDHAIVCMTCGYNTKTGKSLSLQVEGNSAKTSGGTLPGSTAVSGNKAPAPTQLLQSKSEIFMEWGLPVVLGVISIIIMAVMTGIPMTITQVIGSVIRAGILFVASVFIAAKVGEFGYNGIGNAIVKFIAIALVLSAINAVAMKSDWGMMFSGGLSLVALFCLLIVFFDTDMFGAFIVIMVMGVLDNFLLVMVMTAILSWLGGTGGTEGALQNIQQVPAQ